MIELSCTETDELREMFCSRLARSKDDQEAAGIAALYDKVTLLCGVAANPLMRRSQ